MKHSDQIDKVAEALAKAQADIGVAIKRNTATVTSKKGAASSYKYDYASLPDVLAVCKDALSKNGLARTHSTHIDGSRLIVTTKIVHAGSGQWLSTEFPTPIGDGDPQTLGSAQTYGIRYGLMAVCGIATDWDDDDGAAASKPAPSGNVATAPRQQRPETLGAEFAAGLVERLGLAGETVESLRAVIVASGGGALCTDADPAKWSIDLQDRIKGWVNAKVIKARKLAETQAAAADEFPD